MGTLPRSITHVIRADISVIVALGVHGVKAGLVVFIARVIASIPSGTGISRVDTASSSATGIGPIAV